MQPCAERAEALAARVSRLIELRRTDKAAPQDRASCFSISRPIPAPAAGRLSVGLCVAVTTRSKPCRPTAMRSRCLPASMRCASDCWSGNAALLGTDANVHARIPVDDHVRREPSISRRSRSNGDRRPGRQLTDGRNLFVMGERFGNVFVGLQPGFGYEGDPMRLLFESGFAPTHAFTAFYR